MSKKLKQIPNKFPETSQEYYDFLAHSDFYDTETEMEFTERRQLFFAIDEELDKLEAAESYSFAKKICIFGK